MRQLIIPALLLLALLCPGLSQAQFYNGSQMTFGKNRVQHENFFWYYYRFSDYNIYFYAGGNNIAEYTARSAKKIKAKLERDFDYEISDKIHFIVYNKIGQYHQSNIDYVDEEFNTGGQTQLAGNKVFLYYEGDYNQLDQQLREGMATIIMNNMMYGENWKEVIKNSALLSIPDWYINGLISFASRPWNAEIENRVIDGYTSKKYKRFNRLEGIDAVYAGHAIWRYIEEVYGARVIPNIVYMARVSRNVESGFLFVLGISLKELIKNCANFYVQKYEMELKDLEMPEDQLEVKIKKKPLYRNLKKQPGGEKLAYVTNTIGRSRLYVEDLQSGKRKKILAEGTRLQRVNDQARPVVFWSKDGSKLCVITEKKSNSWLTLYDVENGEKTERPIYQLEKILSADFSPNGKQIVLSAINRGQTDLYAFTYASSVLKRLTDDIYDDLFPKYTLDGNHILFSSNRPAENSEDLEMADRSLLGTKDIYALDVRRKKNNLRRITKTPLVDEYSVFQSKDLDYIFLSNNGDVINRYSGIPDSAISHVDTTIHYRYFTNVRQISNYQKNVLEQDYDPGSDEVVQLMLADGRYRFFRENLSRQKVREEEVESTEPEPSIPFDAIEIDRNPVHLEYRSYVVDDPDDPNTVDIYNYRFLSESTPKKQAPQKRYLVPLADSLDATPEIPLSIPNQRNYEMNFTATNMVSAVDFNFANQLYQAFNGGPYTPPGMGAVMKVGVLDLFEDYKIEGGLRIGFNGLNREYFMTLDDRSKRLDKRYSYQRQSLTQINADLSSVDLHVNQFKYILKFPFSETFAIRSTLAVRSDRTVYLSTNFDNLIKNDLYELRVGAKLELIYDNVREKGLNLYNGTRFKVFGERYQLANNLQEDFNVIGFDFRHYEKVHRDLIFATRLAGSTSLGYEKLVYYLGSVDNWVVLSDRPRFDRFTQISQDQNYRFQTIATNMRGFIQNIRNGNSFAVMNNEFRWPLFRYFSNRPLKSEFTSNFQLVLFNDIGSAWTGWNPYSKKNQFNTFIIEEDPLTIYLDNKKDPVVASFGFGFRAKLWGYFVRYDYAWGLEDRRLQNPVTHISLGLDF
jgi:hypothetical protein